MKSLKTILFILLCVIAVQGTKAQELSKYPGLFRSQFYQDNNRITEKEFEELLYSDPTSKSYLKKAEGLSFVSRIFAVGAISSALLLTNTEFGSQVSSVSQFVFIGTSIVTLSTGYLSSNRLRDSILHYNNKFDVGIGVGQSGVGLLVRF